MSPSEKCAAICLTSRAASHNIAAATDALVHIAAGKEVPVVVPSLQPQDAHSILPFEAAQQSPKGINFPPRILILRAAEDANSADCAALAGLGDRLRLNRQFAVRTATMSDAGKSEPVDVAVVGVGSDLTVISSALALAERFGWPEYVFVVADAGDPARAGLLAAGWPHVLSSATAADWLASAAEPLAERARAHAALKRGLATLLDFPPTVVGLETPLGPRDGLFKAEQEFREWFVRSTIARASTRAAAAIAARVPYRTFSQILKTLGLQSFRGHCPDT